MRELFIDIETFSPVNLAKSGVYPYADHDDFELLLFGYSIDGGPVEGSRARASGLGCCLIQDDDLGIGQQGPCQRHLLGLGRGEPGSQSSHQSVDAIGQIPHPFGTDLVQSLHDGLANLVVRPVLGGGW